MMIITLFYDKLYLHATQSASLRHDGIRQKNITQFFVLQSLSLKQRASIPLSIDKNVKNNTIIKYL
jgi:hypothetical protein